MILELITKEFKNMVTKAAKGASNDKLSPMTTYLGISVQDNVLYLRTTDGANFLVLRKKVKCEDFAVVVECNSFVNLIKKTTSEHVYLNIDSDSITIKGNGQYSIPCVTDEHGEPHKFPEAESDFDLSDEKEVKVKSKVFQVVADVNTASVAKTLDTPVLTGFYFDDAVYTTDSLKLCVFNVNVFKRKVLLPIELIKLLTLFAEEDVFVYFIDSTIICETESMLVLGSQMPDIETYPVDALQGLLDCEYAATCKLKKPLLDATLDRLSIFVDDYEKNAITLDFTKEGLKISSKKAQELIPYDASENFTPFSCLIELPKLKEQVNTLQEDQVEFAYGNPDSISIKENKIVHVLATMEEG